METQERRYDIDWIRVIAIGLLLIYHIAISFQPWGGLIQFIQTDKVLEVLWVPMAMLNVWRIPLLFFVSGMGVCFAIRRRDWKGLFKERTLRILVPFVFGIFAIVPLHIFLWQNYYGQTLNFTYNPFHLWFLGNIFIYVVVLSPLFFWLKRSNGKPWTDGLKSLFSTPVGLLIVMLAFIAEAELIAPDSFETYAMNLHGFVLGLMAFLVGFLFVFVGNGFWQMLKKYVWVFLILAFSLYLIRLLVFDLVVPYYLISIESNLWVFSVFGLGYMFLNKKSAQLSYLSQAAYPVYILHMIFLNLSASIVFGWEITGWLQFALVVVFTFLGCFITYELIKSVNFLRPLFGLKLKEKLPVHRVA